MVISIARPRFVPSTITRNAPTSPSAHEIIPIPFPSIVPEHDVTLQLPSDRPDSIQRRQGDRRFPTLCHHRETLWRFEARPARARRRPQKIRRPLLERVPGPWEREGCSGFFA